MFDHVFLLDNTKKMCAIFIHPLIFHLYIYTHIYIYIHIHMYILILGYHEIFNRNSRILNGGGTLVPIFRPMGMFLYIDLQNRRPYIW